MGSPQARKRLFRHAERLAHGQLTASQQSCQTDSIDVLHREKVVPGVLPDEVDLDDMRMDQLRSRCRFGPKQANVLGQVSQLAIQDLDRHPSIKGRFIAQIDIPHPAAPDARDDLKVAELLERKIVLDSDGSATLSATDTFSIHTHL
jgi:hypothetical protein